MKLPFFELKFILRNLKVKSKGYIPNHTVLPKPEKTTFSNVPIYRSCLHCHTVSYHTVTFHLFCYSPTQRNKIQLKPDWSNIMIVIHHPPTKNFQFQGGGSLAPYLYFRNLYFMVKLGWPENFIALGCLEVLGKFLVGGGGGWVVVDFNQRCSYSNLVSVELNYVGLDCNNYFPTILLILTFWSHF